MHVEVGAGTSIPRRLLAALGLLLALCAPVSARGSESVPADIAPQVPAGVPRQPRVAEPAPDPLAAWSRPGDLLARATRARLAALEVGIGSFDAPARALLLAPGESPVAVDRAEAAAALAPDLPLTQWTLAGVLLRERHDPGGAASAFGRAIAALVRHPEARLWLEANGLLALRNALFFGALAFLAGAALCHGRAAAHDLGDRVSRRLPTFARAGLLGVLLLVPAMAGEGLLGLGLSCFALVLGYGSVGERRAAWGAALLLVAALSGGSRLAADAVAAFEPDPLVAALRELEAGFASTGERARLEAAAPSDPLAARGLALDARRQGRLEDAAQRYEALFAAGHTDVSSANNAANVWLALGNVDRAIALYEIAARGASPVVLYNLAYAYGQAIRPSAQDETLQRLQRLDPGLAFELTQLQAKVAGGFTLDLPLPRDVVRARSRASAAAGEVAGELRRPLAPGALGADPVTAGVAFLLVGFAARGIFRHVRVSGGCRRCGTRLCPRCDGVAPARERCGACQRLFERPETADPERRARRLAELEQRFRRLARLRLAASLSLPGAAGLLARRPWLGLAGSLAFCTAAAFALFSRTGIADPLVAGGAGVFAATAVAAMAAALDLVLVLRALQRRTGARG